MLNCWLFRPKFDFVNCTQNLVIMVSEFTRMHQKKRLNPKNPVGGMPPNPFTSLCTVVAHSQVPLALGVSRYFLEFPFYFCPLICIPKIGCKYHCILTHFYRCSCILYSLSPHTELCIVCWYLSGCLIDQFGRKFAIIFNSFLFIFGAVLLAFANSFPFLVSF